MGFLNWIKAEIDSTNINKKRCSKSTILNQTFSSEDIRDEAYATALSKFNEWRKEKEFGTLSKKNQKQLHKMLKKLESIKNKKCTGKNNISFNKSVLNEEFYEEIDKEKVSLNAVKDKHKIRKNTVNQDCFGYSGNITNIEEIKKSIPNNIVIYENESQTLFGEDMSNLDSPNREFKYISSPLHNENSKILESNKTKSNYKQKHRKSPSLYQSMINKHGDVVEYALPLFENAIDYNQLNSVEIPRNSIINQCVNEEFQFTNETYLARNIRENSKNEPQMKSIVITDLDKCDTESGYTNINNNIETENIMEELETLEKWSKSIETNINPELKSNRKHFDKNLTGTVISSMSEVKINSSEPIKLYGSKIYSGTFRGAFISQQKKEDFYASHQDEAILLNFDKLRKFRHPDIALLMGITTNNLRKINSLIFEAFKCSLNNEIHKTDNHIPIDDVLKYSIQLARAVAYCHENGLTHSNICSETILISSSEKIIKLSSFELATTGDIVESIEHCDKEISLELLPHLVNYRQVYSNHCYQSPELITTKLKYVFPTNQSDIYGICLTIWEMLNKSIPFALCNYKDLENLFYLQNAILPIFEIKRCHIFKDILEKGLKINPKQRFKSAKNLFNMLMQISKQISTVPTLTNIFKDSNVATRNSCPHMIYDKTSTIKNFKPNEHTLYECVDTTNSIVNSTPENFSEHKSNLNSKNIFEINDFHLPSTPIARSNQLLKTAWLSEAKMSPIEKLDESKEISNNTINLEQVYNVKIKIMSKDSSKDGFTYYKSGQSIDISNDQSNICSISNKINYWNTISSSQIKENDLLKHTEEKLNQFEKSNTIENINNTNQNRSPIPMAELLNKSVGKQCRNSNISFEDSQWKRENNICNNFDISHKNRSVKDTVKKFESFSNKCQQYDENTKLDFFPLKLKHNTKENDKTFFDNIETCTIFEENDNFSNSPKDCNITHESNIENDEIKTTSLEIEFNTVQEYTPKEIYKSNLDIILGNNNKEITDSNKESQMRKLNHQKINRRSSDISWYCRKIRAHDNTKADYGRHSVCNTELLKQLEKFKQFNREKVNYKFSPENENIQNTDENLQNLKDYKLHMGKLTCCNCGCKVFVINGSEKEYQRLSLPLSSAADLQISKSIEDLYIDDDFCQFLGTNMELGTESELYNFFDSN